MKIKETWACTQESNKQPFCYGMTFQPTEPYRPGPDFYITIKNIKFRSINTNTLKSTCIACWAQCCWWLGCGKKESETRVDRKGEKEKGSEAWGRLAHKACGMRLAHSLSWGGL